MTVLIVIFLLICALAFFWGYAGARRSGPAEIPKSIVAERKCFRYTEDGKQYIAYEGSEMYALIFKAINRRGR